MLDRAMVRRRDVEAGRPRKPERIRIAMDAQLSSALHQTQRFRHEPKRRSVRVARVAALTPKMLRLEFASPELHDFSSLSPDDHVKVFFPDAGSPSGLCMRDYTPRAFDVEKGELTIDFALHDAGPATLWAMSAKVGDVITIGGPRGSAVAPDDFDYYLLIGDETALPAIARRVETLRAGAVVTTLVVVDGPQEAQRLVTKADWTPLWAFRTGRNDDDAAILREALQGWRTPGGDGYVWIAAEAHVARDLRRHLLEDKGHPKAWLKAAGYWIKGQAGESEKF